jgi:hypothetical protein
MDSEKHLENLANLDEKKHNSAETHSESSVNLNNEPNSPGSSSRDHDAEDKPRHMKGWVWFLVVVSVISATLLFAIDTTIVANIQPVLVEDLGEIEKLPWISVALVASANATSLLW